MEPAMEPESPKDAVRLRRSVDTFRVSSTGFRRIFGKHFPKHVEDVEAVAFHLGKVEALLPTTREAIRLARYPGAGNRNPKRMALGLVENLSVLANQLRNASEALGRLARSHDGRPATPAAAPASPAATPAPAPAQPSSGAAKKATKTATKKKAAKKTAKPAASKPSSKKPSSKKR